MRELSEAEPHCKNRMAGPQKHTGLPHNQQFHLLVFTRTDKDFSAIWTPVFTAKHSGSECPSTGDWISKVWSVHTTDYFITQP